MCRSIKRKALGAGGMHSWVHHMQVLIGRFRGWDLVLGVLESYGRAGSRWGGGSGCL